MISENASGLESGKETGILFYSPMINTMQEVPATQSTGVNSKLMFSSIIIER